MTNSATQRPAARSVADLEAELARREDELASTIANRDAAVDALPEMILGEDELSVASARRAIANLDSKIRTSTEALDSIRRALQIASERETAANGERAYRRAEDLVSAAVRKICELEKVLVTAGEAIVSARNQLDQADIELGQCGVPFDSYRLAQRLVAIAELRLFLESKGALGVRHTLLSDLELRQGGYVSLERAANEYAILSLRAARTAMRLPPEPDQAA